MSQEYANKLEVWFRTLPSLVQETLNEPFSWINDGLKAVSGDPQALLAAAPQYMQIAEMLTTIRHQQLSDRNALVGQWNGDACHAFSARIDDIDQKIGQVAEAIRKIPALLEHGAHACVEGTNMIIDLVVSLIMFAVSELVVNVAVSILILGANAAASVALVLARAAQTLARVARVIEKVAEVLVKLAKMFQRIHGALKRVVEVLNQLRTYLQEVEAAAKAAKGMEWVRKTASFYAQNAVVSIAIDKATFGLVAPPTTGGSLLDAGGDYARGLTDAHQAEDAVK